MAESLTGKYTLLTNNKQENILPLTHVNAVLDDGGNPLGDKIDIMANKAADTLANLEGASVGLDGVDYGSVKGRLDNEYLNLMKEINANNYITEGGNAVTTFNTYQGVIDNMEIQGNYSYNVIGEALHTKYGVQKVDSSKITYDINTDYITMNGDSDGFTTLIADYTNGALKFKPGQTYTVVFDLASYKLKSDTTGKDPNIVFADATNGVFVGVKTIDIRAYNKDIGGRIVFTLQTANPIETTHCFKMYIYNAAYSSIKFRLMILEGDWTRKEIPPYSRGLIFSGTQRNLCNMNDYKVGYFGGADGKTWDNTSSASSTTRTIFIKVSQNKRYTVVYNKNGTDRFVLIASEFANPTSGYKGLPLNTPSGNNFKQIIQTVEIPTGYNYLAIYYCSDDATKLDPDFKIGVYLGEASYYTESTKDTLQFKSVGENLFNIDEIIPAQTNYSTISRNPNYYVTKGTDYFIQNKPTANNGYKQGVYLNNFWLRNNPNLYLGFNFDKNKSIYEIADNGSEPSIKYFKGAYPSKYNQQDGPISENKAGGNEPFLLPFIRTKDYNAAVGDTKVAKPMLKLFDHQPSQSEIDNMKYVPYKEDIRSIELPVLGLKRMPNGACDKIYVKNNRVIYEQWTTAYAVNVNRIIGAARHGQYSNDTTSLFLITLSMRENETFTQNSGSVLCEQFMTVDDIVENWIPSKQPGLEYIWKGRTINVDNIAIQINNNRLSKWLPENPTVDQWNQSIVEYIKSMGSLSCYFELAKPIIHELDITNLNLKSYDGSTTIFSNNHLDPLFKFDIPVDTGATISRLKAANFALQNDNRMLNTQLFVANQNLEDTKNKADEERLNRVTQDLDLDFRISELEFASMGDFNMMRTSLFVAPPNLVKKSSKQFTMMSTLIDGNKYDKDRFISMMDGYLNMGKITQEEYDILKAKME